MGRLIREFWPAKWKRRRKNTRIDGEKYGIGDKSSSVVGGPELFWFLIAYFHAGGLFGLQLRLKKKSKMKKRNVEVFDEI